MTIGYLKELLLDVAAWIITALSPLILVALIGLPLTMATTLSAASKTTDYTERLK